LVTFYVRADRYGNDFRVRVGGARASRGEARAPLPPPPGYAYGLPAKPSAPTALPTQVSGF